MFVFVCSALMDFCVYTPLCQISHLSMICQLSPRCEGAHAGERQFQDFSFSLAVQAPLPGRANFRIPVVSSAFQDSGPKL